MKLYIHLRVKKGMEYLAENFTTKPQQTKVRSKMSDYSECANCGREAKDALSSNYFPVYECNDCGQMSCEHCGGDSCPACGSSNSRTVGKVYAD
jgi:hypothetical protein